MTFKSLIQILEIEIPLQAVNLDLSLIKLNEYLVFISFPSLKAKAWESHRGTWGTAIYEHPVQRATHDDMTKLKNVLRAAKLPPCSLKGHRHYGALAEPV